MCVFLTRHMSLVLKFFLHFSHTANLESGNFTFSDCLNPGGVKVKIFCLLYFPLSVIRTNEFGIRNQIDTSLWTPSCDSLTPWDIAWGNSICFESVRKVLR